MLLKPAASRDVRPTLGIPALTSRAGVSLSFMFLTALAASRQPLLRAPNLRPSIWWRVFPAHGLSLFSRSAGLRVLLLPRAGGYCFPGPQRGGSLPLPFIF